MVCSADECGNLERRGPIAGARLAEIRRGRWTLRSSYGENERGYVEVGTQTNLYLLRIGPVLERVISRNI